MAYYFMMSVECGSLRDDAQLLSKHFDNFQISVSKDLSTLCWSGTSQDSQGNWWSVTSPKGTSYAGFAPIKNTDGTIEYKHDEHVVQSIEEMKCITDALYLHLQKAPAFRYALCGYETEHFLEIHELLETNFGNLHIPGLVLNEEICSSGRPTKFVTFALGYIWQPPDETNYKGMRG